MRPPRLDSCGCSPLGTEGECQVKLSSGRPLPALRPIKALVMLLWPQPLQRVEGSPWNASVGSEKDRPLDSMRTAASSLAMRGNPFSDSGIRADYACLLRSYCEVEKATAEIAAFKRCFN